MATRHKVQHLRSSVANAIPAVSALTDGEIAINLANSRLFIKNAASGISTFIESSATQTLINNMGNTKLSVTGGTISGDLLITSGGSTDGNLTIDYGYLQSNDLQTKALKLYDRSNTGSFGTNITLVASGSDSALFFSFVSGVTEALVDVAAGNVYSNGILLLKEGKTVAAGGGLSGGGSIVNSSSGVTISHNNYGAATYSASSTQYISSVTRDAYGHITGASYASLPAGKLSGLTDTSISAVTSNQILRWNGTAWTNSNETGLNLVTTATGTAYGIVAVGNHTVSAKTLTSSDVGSISTARTVTATSGLTYTGGPLSSSDVTIIHSLRPTTGGSILTPTANSASTNALTSIALDIYGHLVSGTSIGIDAANGLAKLDANGKIKLSNLSDFLLGQVVYGGTIAANGIVTLSNNGKGKLGTTASTIDISAITISTAEGLYVIASTAITATTVASLSAFTGDWILSNGIAWGKIDNTDAVTSVNGGMGAVSITTTSISAVPTSRTISYNGPISGSSNLSTNITIGHHGFNPNAKTTTSGITNTFDVIDTITRDAYGHISTLNTKTVSVPIPQTPGELGYSIYVGVWQVPDSDFSGYTVGEVVEHLNKLYICIADNIFAEQGSIDISNTSYWKPYFYLTFSDLAAYTGTTSSAISRGDHTHSVTIGSGITKSGDLSSSGSGLTISHALYTTSAFTANSGYYISSVTRDGLGHVVGAGSAILSTSALNDTLLTSVSGGQYLMYSGGTTNKWINVDLSIDCGTY